MKIRKDVSFKDLTTFKVGGFAKTVAYPETKEEVREALKEVIGNKERCLILGGGSNVVPSDDYFEGTIIIPYLNNLEIQNDTLICGAGFTWDDLVLESAKNDLWGIENLSAIPGTVGGSIFQNIGAYGSVLSDVLESVFVYNIKEDKFETLSKKDCKFGYRNSLFKENKNDYVILEIILKLSKNPKPNTEYKDLKEIFKDEKPDLLEIRNAVIKIREGKFPSLKEYGTAGSFFLNPVVNEEEVEVFKARFPEMPTFSMPEGGVKVPLAWLLDRRNGVMDINDFREGGAFVWNKQTLVLATESGATASDIKKLAEKIKTEVKNKINLEINFEVNFL